MWQSHAWHQQIFHEIETLTQENSRICSMTQPHKLCGGCLGNMQHHGSLLRECINTPPCRQVCWNPCYSGEDITHCTFCFKISPSPGALHTLSVKLDDGAHFLPAKQRWRAIATHLAVQILAATNDPFPHIIRSI